MTRVLERAASMNTQSGSESFSVWGLSSRADYRGIAVAADQACGAGETETADSLSARLVSVPGLIS